MGVVGRALNESISLLVFTLLDVLDAILCVVYKIADFVIEAQWRPCYCSSSHNGNDNNKILVSEKGNATKIVRVVSSSSSSSSPSVSSKLLQLEDVSDTLFSRPSLMSEISKKLWSSSSSSSSSVIRCGHEGMSAKKKGGRTAFRVNSTLVEMLQGKIQRGKPSVGIPRWSDCDCKTCNGWSSPFSKDSLFVHRAGAPIARSSGGGDKATEDVVFIHGFISSSKFWTETLFPNLTGWAKSKHRLFAVDLLGFGRSPKPSDSLYTLREHVEMIERSVLESHGVKSFHIVAHSLGCILAFALAVRHPTRVKSLTLIAPPYFPVPKGEEGTEYVLRRVAPRKVWPPMAFGSSLACWYEHISRTICLLICKNHRLWEFLVKLLTRNRLRTYLVEGFCCHTHNAAWHTVHNIICGQAGKLDKYLDIIRDRLTCNVTIFHGKDDEVLPVECSYNVQSRIPRAQVKVLDGMDHITIVVSRQKTFARELQAIWAASSATAATA